MAADGVSLDLLAHFDGPVAPAVACQIHTRGVGWVLQWAAALATLSFAASVMTEFGYCLAAEQELARAARAGALEATLPGATHGSVAATIERRLADASPSSRLRFSLLQNGAPVRGAFHPRGGDQLCVALAVPSDAILPGWLRAMNFWRSDTLIEARAEQQMPGRELQTSPPR